MPAMTTTNKLQIAVMVVGLIVTASGWVWGAAVARSESERNSVEIERLRQKFELIPERLSRIEAMQELMLQALRRMEDRQ